MSSSSFDLPSVKERFGSVLLPGAVGRDTFSVGGATPCAVRSSGYIVIDENGHELIDANGNHTSMIHGNAHPEIVEAAERAIRDGSSWGVPNQTEWQHAEALLAKFPSMRQVRYANSGTEAVMTALRLARASTGRNGVIALEGAYHGSSDTALVAGQGKNLRGVTQSTVNDVSLIPVNDAQQLQETIDSAPGQFAAIIIDAMPNRAGLVSVSQEFLYAARNLASKHGIVLIMDEVISLRLGPSGISGALGITPDLITAAKYIGGGFPVGAVIGTADLMARLDPQHPESMPNAGTFTGNPVSMAAGLKAIELLTEDEIQRINDLGDYARAKVAREIDPLGWEMRGYGSLLRPYPKDGRPAPKIQQAIWHSAYASGLLLTQTNLGAISTAMDQSVVDAMADRLTAAVVDNVGADQTDR